MSQVQRYVQAAKRFPPPDRYTTYIDTALLVQSGATRLMLPWAKEFLRSSDRDQISFAYTVANIGDEEICLFGPREPACHMNTCMATRNFMFSYDANKSGYATWDSKTVSLAGDRLRLCYWLPIPKDNDTAVATIHRMKFCRHC